jgi:iron(III) transport system ATP-binding protein
MDEPLSNLDAKMRMQMRDVILDLVQDARITTVFVTHDQEEALAMSDKVAIMDQGRIAQIGTPEELYGTPASAYVADFIGSANIIAVPLEPEGQAASSLRYRLSGRTLDGVAGAARVDGRDAILIARPEELTRAAATPVVANAVPGAVLRRQYLGFKTAYRIQLHDGPEIRVDLSAGNRHADFHPGDAVQVVLPPNSRLIQRPR